MVITCELRQTPGWFNWDTISGAYKCSHSPPEIRPQSLIGLEVCRSCAGPHDIVYNTTKKVCKLTTVGYGIGHHERKLILWSVCSVYMILGADNSEVFIIIEMTPFYFCNCFLLFTVYNPITHKEITIVMFNPIIDCYRTPYVTRRPLMILLIFRAPRALIFCW